MSTAKHAWLLTSEMRVRLPLDPLPVVHEETCFMRRLNRGSLGLRTAYRIMANALFLQKRDHSPILCTPISLVIEEWEENEEALFGQ